MYDFRDMYGVRRTDGHTDKQMHGQTDGWKKWHIEVDAPPKKYNIFEK